MQEFTFLFSIFFNEIHILTIFVCNFAENLLRGSVATDQDSRLSWSEHINRSAVKFAGEEMEENAGMDDEEVRYSGFFYFLDFCRGENISPSLEG